ncbi:MAG: hypothetical protein ILA17_03695 [Ruminococcus sp.]|nr:hypothetical protein [Ruminococcus sp.]
MNIIVTSANQKVITTHKTRSDAEHLYSIDNIEAVKKAARELKSTAFKLYVIMNLNQNEYTYALSPKALHESIGISGGQYHRAVQELMERGYLIEDDKRKNLYHFYELPAENDTVIPKMVTGSAINDTESNINDSESAINGLECVQNFERNNTAILQDNNTRDNTTDNKCYSNTDIYNKDSTTAKPDLKISNSSILDDVADYISDCCIKSNKDNSTVYDTDLMDYEAVMSDDCIPF